MSAAAPDASPTAERDDSYVSEVRFGVVMYGGVSLAIYINGVANELYEMACATPKTKVDGEVSGTRGIYRKASFLLNDKELCKRYVAHVDDPEAVPDPFDKQFFDGQPPRTRFIVDVISGTSAGGINGAFLAKALANGQQFSPLKDLWIEEGNIESLLNDDASYDGIAYAKKSDSAPQSLLNSDRMYIKLLEAFRSMNDANIPKVEGESPLVDEIDLYMTTTDIRGSLVPLRLFDGVTYEKRFKQVYHFQYATANGEEFPHHFTEGYAPFLAFAARCTSSFPYAFEPMTVDDAERLCEAKRESADFGDWKPFFTGLSDNDMMKGGWKARAFGDGGYLDNKPFSYVVEALSWRLGELPMDRKLIYVDPAPEHPEKDKNSTDKPDAIENAFAALNTIPRYETIREDLETILTRNRRIERVEKIVRQVEADIELGFTDPFKNIELDNGQVPDWSSRDMTDMIRYYGVAFLPYRRLRMTTVTDDLAERLAVWWDIDRGSDRFYSLRAMARVWRESRYYENKGEKKGRTKTVNQFLNEYDVRYRLRRAGFLLRKVHLVRGLVGKIGQFASKLPKSDDPPSLDELKKLLSDVKPQLSDAELRILQRVYRRGGWLWSMKPREFIDALDCLADGFGQALRELRATCWLQAPKDPASRQKRADLHETLDQLLGFILDGKTSPPELKSIDGASVPVKVEELPPPSRSRTLQENVFARAEALFGLAQGASRTELQVVLEKDLDTLRESYAQVIGAGADHKGALVRKLLGNPKLAPLTPSDKTQPSVVTHVDDEIGSPYDVLDTPEGNKLRKFFAEYYLRFDEYDQMSFPLYYGTDIGEPSTVEVLRVSPEDAPSLINERVSDRKKLAGTRLFNFSAFFDERWRRNDIMWGRLDGCERLLAALFPATEDQPVRDALLKEAQHIIIPEEIYPEGYAKRVDLFVKALAEQKGGPLKQAFDGLWDGRKPPDDELRNTQAALAFKAAMGDDGMVAYVRKYYEVDRKFNAAVTSKAGARALTITGRILEESEKRYREAKPSKTSMVWVTRGGRALQTLLTISTPGGLPHAVSRHWLGLLYIFEVLLVLGALALSAPAARSFGLTALAVTLAVHVASLFAGDLMYDDKWRATKIVGLVLVLIILALAVVGVLTLAGVDVMTPLRWFGAQLKWLLHELCGCTGGPAPILQPD
jgi:patatin-related protein